jgi:ubiquinone biosynthesis protein COQ4
MNSVNPINRYRFRPFQAMDAIQKLIRNKDDTTQVFRLLQALRGWSFDRMFTRFKATDVGARVIAEKQDLVKILCNRSYLESLPPASLGRAFQDFMDSCGITSDGLNEAARDSGLQDANLPEDFRRFSIRLRVQHDLWHVVTGYGCEGLGEVCNVAFSYPQTGNFGFMVIGWFGGRNYAKAFPNEPIMSAMWEGYKRGRRAAWLPGVDWEAMLPKPLTEVRALLGLSAAPAKYLAAPVAIKQSLLASPVAA